MALFGGVGYVYIFFLLAVISGKAPLTAELRLLWALRGVPLSLLMKQEQKTKKKKKKEILSRHTKMAVQSEPPSLCRFWTFSSLSLYVMWKPDFPGKELPEIWAAQIKSLLTTQASASPVKTLKGGCGVQSQSQTRSRARPAHSHDLRLSLVLLNTTKCLTPIIYLLFI